MDCIKNIDDVKRFFRILYEERRVAFHPDDKFEQYICNATGEQTFSASECEQFNRLMDDCFKVCETVDIDIYELACELRDHLVTA